MKEEKFYNKFVEQKSSKTKAEIKNKRKEFNQERDKYFDEKRKGLDKKQKIQKVNDNLNRTQNTDAKIVSIKNIFDTKSLPNDAIKVLEEYDSIVQSVRPMNSKQLQKLPKDIHILSHLLTDERESRRAGYMNAVEELSAYIRYFTWWNLVRLTRIFSNLADKDFSLNDGDVMLDIGSGPLTVVSALWLSRPELRNKDLTVYCMDISQSTMAVGEDIYMSIAAKALPTDKNAKGHWNIIRVKGEIGTSIRKKANFISCANMFNELYQKEHENPEKIADKQIKNLMNYAQENASFFIAEPGMPTAGHFISLMRERFIKQGFRALAPCSHQQKCPMNGLHARYGGSAKWCNFSFTTQDAPKKLLKLSEDSGLPKERAVVSFIFVQKQSEPYKQNESLESQDELQINIMSDPIYLSNHKTGFYSCSQKGMLVCTDLTGKDLKSGDKIKVQMNKRLSDLQKDRKSNAPTILL